MSIWESLGLEPTNDIAAIKKAYAAKAKTVHPEEHPEEFRRLQDAYKAAVKVAKFMKPPVNILSPGAELGMTGAEEPGPGMTEAAEPRQKSGMIGDAEPAGSESKMTEDAEPAGSELKMTEAAKPGQESRTTGIEEPTGQESGVTGGAESQESEPGKTEAAEPGLESPGESAADTSPQFDYGSVQELPEDAASRFWEEFQFIRWNPCLRNQIACWKCFLHQPEYEKLLMQSSVREELIRQIIQDKPINWTLTVMEYLTRTLKSFQMDKKGPYETEDRKWLRFRKRVPTQKGRTSKNLIPSPFFRKREKRLFCSIEGTEALAWDAKVNMEQYLNDYFAFARENSYELERMYKGHTRWVIWRPWLISMAVIAVFYAWMFIPGLLTSGSRDSRPFYEEKLEQLQQEYERNSQNAQERERMQEEMNALLESYEAIINSDQK